MIASVKKSLFGNVCQKRLELFESDKFVLLEALKKQSDPLIERLYFISKCILYACGDLLHCTYPIAAFPELAADLVEVNFIVGFLKKGQ